MRSPNPTASVLIVNTAIATLLLNSSLPASADNRIRGEFEYSLDKQTLSEWEIGPVFELGKSTELEIPVGQDDGKWQAKVELLYEVEVEENFELEFIVGLEVAEDEPMESFGGIEGSWDL